MSSNGFNPVKWYMSNQGDGGAQSPRANVGENTFLSVYGYKGNWRFTLMRTIRSGWGRQILYWDEDEKYDTCALAKKAATRWFGNWVLAMAFNNGNKGLEMTKEQVEDIQGIWGTEDDYEVKV